MTIPQSFIKSVDIEIGDHYILENTPHPFLRSKTKYRKIPFLGRKAEIGKFLEFLNSSTRKGVFLVT